MRPGRLRDRLVHGEVDGGEDSARSTDSRARVGRSSCGRGAWIVLLLVSLSVLGCQAPPALGKNGEPIFRQAAISDIACGPSALFNWMSHGDQSLQGVLATLSRDRTPTQTVQHIIDSYGKRRSATNPSVTRYGRHNGGVGSVNLMLMAQELVGDHLASPPTLRGEYLHRLDAESTQEHLQRIAGWFSESIAAGVPVLLYLRRYERTADAGPPRMVFGHHVVVTSLDWEVAEGDRGAQRIGLTFVDSSSGRAERGDLMIAEREFTVPTFSYRFDGDRALTTERLRTGRPLLEVRVPAYDSRRSLETEITVAHFATFAEADS